MVQKVYETSENWGSQRLFNQLERIRYWDLARNRYSYLTKRSADILNRRGKLRFVLQRPTTRTTKGNLIRYWDLARNRYVNITKRSADLINRRGKIRFVRRKPSPIATKTTPPPKIVTPGNVTQTDVNNAITNLRTEQFNLKTWITEVNARLSRQVSELGQSTIDRSNEINALNQRAAEASEYANEMNERLSGQMVEVGAAVSDVSKALQVVKAEKIVEDVKQKTGGFLGGIGGYLTDPRTILIAVAVVIFIIILKFKK